MTRLLVTGTLLGFCLVQLGSAHADDWKHQRKASEKQRKEFEKEQKRWRKAEEKAADNWRKAEEKTAKQWRQSEERAAKAWEQQQRVEVQRQAYAPEAAYQYGYDRRNFYYDRPYDRRVYDDRYYDDRYEVVPTPGYGRVDDPPAYRYESYYRGTPTDGYYEPVSPNRGSRIGADLGSRVGAAIGGTDGAWIGSQIGAEIGDAVDR